METMGKANQIDTLFEKVGHYIQPTFRLQITGKEMSPLTKNTEVKMV